MKILLVSATHAEIAPFLKSVQEEGQQANKFSIDYNKHNLDIIITGVGMVATAFALGKTLQNKYDLAINIGLAGSFKRNISLGAVVNVMQDKFTEMGAEDGNSFLTLAELKLQDESEFPFHRGEIENEISFSNKFLEKIPEVKGITVNMVHGNELSIERTIKRFNPDVESMEGGAFLYCCLKEGITCAQVRAISNYVERRNREAWNIPLALENLNKKLIEIINEL